MLSRRDFLASVARVAPLAGAAGLGWDGPAGAAELARILLVDPLESSAPRARYWVGVPATEGDCLACHGPAEIRGRAGYRHRERAVRCLLCAQACAIEAGARGRCRARANVNGELRSLVYGRPLAVHVDPIEKKPFYHFLPGASAFSLGTAGCPLRCRFCQNWELSQAAPDDHDVDVLSPKAVVEAATAREVPVIAFTYNEPTVFVEYLLDIAAAGRARGVRSVMVSCGLMNERPLTDLCQALDAIKIDLKGFSESFYRDVCGASLAPVLRTLRQIARSGTHLEIVNLVVPTLNDSEAALAALASWVVGELGPDVPLHFTRFHPDYQLLHLPPTPVATLERARALALEKGVHYAYVGNVPGHPGNHTYCPRCGRTVIMRDGFFVAERHLDGRRCRFCHAEIAGVWS